MKILVTGGHPAPAIALIDFARNNKDFKDLDFVFVGRKYNNEREKSLSFEYKEITDRDIPFYHLTAGRVTRLFDLNSLVSMLYVPFGFYNAWRILMELRPDRILTFGGYLALPIAYVAKKMGIPVYIHEQTIAPGVATQKIGQLADTIFLSFPDSKNGLPKKKCVVTGNLVRDAIFRTGQLKFAIPSKKPVLYVTGGSLGSHSLNVHVETILPKLLESFFVIHQTGNIEEFNDFERLKEYKNTLPKNLRDQYVVLDHVPDSLIGAIYKAADVVVSRSGANTVTELVALKKPSILVPLPWSARNEQQLQAELLEKAGVATIFKQDGESNQLLEAIQQTFQDRVKIKSHFQSLEVLYNPNAPRVVLEKVIEG